MELVQGPPAAQPSVVVKSAVVGFTTVLHAIPEVVIVKPPFETIVPPPDAVVSVIAVIGVVVVTVATRHADESNTTSEPYEVPTLFVA
jgi:hypothetical protein